MTTTFHVILITLIATAASFRFSLTEKAPSLSLYFEVQGKQTFSLVSSGEEYHNVTVLIEYSTPQMIGS